MSVSYPFLGLKSIPSIVLSLHILPLLDDKLFICKWFFTIGQNVAMNIFESWFILFSTLKIISIASISSLEKLNYPRFVFWWMWPNCWRDWDLSQIPAAPAQNQLPWRRAEVVLSLSGVQVTGARSRLGRKTWDSLLLLGTCWNP